MIQNLIRIAVVSAFAVAGAAQAQKAADTTNTPQRAGEASTMTGGAPNAKTSNDAATTSSTDKAAKKSAKAAKAKGDKSAAKGAAAATTNVPDRAGEASTMTGGAPNKKTAN